MIHGKYYNQGDDIANVIKMRKVILRKDRDEKDKEAVNVLVDLMGEPIGCGRILCDVDSFRFIIDQVGILEEHRGKGYGEFALRILVDKANACGASYVWAEIPEDKKAYDFFKGLHFNEEDGLLKAEIKDFHNCCHG